MSKQSVKKRIFDVIQIGQQNDALSRTFDYFLAVMILLNIAVLFLETFSELQSYQPLFHALEWFTLGIFCVEYALRVYTAEFLFPGVNRRTAIWKFIISFDGIIMLLTILPFFYLTGFGVFRILRVVRIFHLFRINANYDSFHVITSVLRDMKNPIISSVFIIIILMMASSLCMYSVEHRAQPEAFRNALSGIWWSLSTIFTVGYGDIYPITMLGRIMAIVITFLGVGAVAIPTGIISAGFVDHYSRMKRRENLDMSGRHTVSVSVDSESPFLSCAVKEIEKKFQINVAVIIRGDNVILPSDDVKIQEQDLVVYLQSPEKL